MIVRGKDASDATGISLLHAQVFQLVADVTGDVIACRAVGKFATGLIAEGYASKGYHNKAKSCNWGPMAGFVLVDPRFTKASDPAAQQSAITQALVGGATAVPLFISTKRIMFLLREGLFRPFHAEPGDYVAWCHNEAVNLQFRLRRAETGLYSVLYCQAEPRSRVIGPDHMWTPVMALRDRHCTLPSTSRLSATTGDYDLFAIWGRVGRPAKRPNIAVYNRRMVSHRELETNINAGRADTGEHPHLGNLTPRIAVARFLLNEGFRRAGYEGGDMVHHSDEGGRPFVQNIDFPVFSVIPGQTEAYCMSTPDDLVEFIHDHMGPDFDPILSPGWLDQLEAAGLHARHT